MGKNEFLLAAVWNLETAEAELSEDINFLNCVEEQFFICPNEKERATYLLWQFGAMIRTVRKSMESTQKSMRESIEAIYKEKRKVNSK